MQGRVCRGGGVMLTTQLSLHPPSPRLQSWLRVSERLQWERHCFGRVHSELVTLVSLSAVSLLFCGSDVFQSHGKLCPSDWPRGKPHPRLQSKWLQEAGSHGTGCQAQPHMVLAEAQVLPNRFHPQPTATGRQRPPSWYVRVKFWWINVALYTWY